MDISTYVSLGNFVLFVLGGIIYYVREDTIVKKVSEYQSAELKQVYMDHLALASKVEKHIDHHNDFKSKISTETAVMSKGMENMSNTLDKLETTLKEFTIEIRGLMRGKK